MSSKKEVWAVLTEPEGMEPHPTWGDVMPIDEWMDCVRSGGFIDYDGYGNFATETKYLPCHNVYPSMVKKPGFIFPAWATHIVWYNR